MDICIGSNLRRLRKAKDITQEELAEFLGVSFQSVSKWERGDCYPDIALLPGIANFFGVTIDELMGMNDINKQSRLGDIYKQVHELETGKQYQEAVHVLRKALKLFPNNYGLLSELAIALSSEHMRAALGHSALEEALMLSERVLDNCANEKIRSTTRANLCFLYQHMGQRQKAVALAKTLPHIWESREMLLPELMDEQEYKNALRASITTVLAFLHMRLDGINAQGYQGIIGTGLPDSGHAAAGIDEMMSRISGFLE